ncbi:MAG TPA: arginine--tRNA ligase, partial [Ruminococcaceae bacterium]|nr:arginine--tRNA ligase [Oscillospiraceae bacterium]
LLTADEERQLIRHLAFLPAQIIEAAKDLDPSKMTRYVQELAALFHKFYNACRVKCDDPALMQARLALCLAVRTAIANVLALLKIDAPETM